MKKEIEINDVYRTKDGYTAIVIATDLTGNFPILTICEKGKLRACRVFKKNGQHLNNIKSSGDLILEDKISIAVIDLSTASLDIYDVPCAFDSEQIEEFLREKGFHLSNCSWGEFQGEINDHRKEEHDEIVNLVTQNIKK